MVLEMISPATIEQIKDLSLVKVVGDYLPELKKSGAGTWKAISPWNNEKSASFFVVERKNLWKDHSSGRGGLGPISFVMAKENVEYLDAVKILAEANGIPIAHDESENGLAEYHKQQQEKRDIHAANSWAHSWFVSNEVPDVWLKARKFKRSTIETVQIGYAPDGWDNLMKAGNTQNFSNEILLKAGLLRTSENGKIYDTFRNRIIFPVHDYRGQVIGFTGRTAADEQPKYIHTEGMEKQKNLLGLYHAIKRGKINEGVNTVEGPTDWLRLIELNCFNTISSLGSYLSEDQARVLKKYCDQVTIIADNDADKTDNPGLKALHANAKILLAQGFTVKILLPS